MSRTEVDCVACHRHEGLPQDVAEVVGQTFTAVGEACEHCHGAKYAGSLDEWRQRLAHRQAGSDEAYDAAVALVEGATVPDEIRTRAERLLADARHNRRLVELGRGVHNINYATALLSAADEFCREAEEVVRQHAGP
jgi:hypothetical protein